MRKRILVITHAGGSPFHGPNMRWYYLGLALKPLGVDVEIVSSSSFQKYISPPRVETALETCKVGPLTYHWIRTRPYRVRGVAQVINQIELYWVAIDNDTCWVLEDSMSSWHRHHTRSWCIRHFLSLES